MFRGFTDSDPDDNIVPNDDDRDGSDSSLGHDSNEYGSDEDGDK